MSKEFEFEERKPDLIYYSIKKELSQYYVLAKCPVATEYISPNYNIYADKELTIPIGYITGKILQDQNITSYTGYVKFTTFNGALTYYSINPDGYESPIYNNTILAGSGDLLGTTGIVSSIANKNYLANYVYFNKK